VLEYKTVKSYDRENILQIKQIRQISSDYDAKYAVPISHIFSYTIRCGALKSLRNMYWCLVGTYTNKLQYHINTKICTL